MDQDLLQNIDALTQEVNRLSAELEQSKRRAVALIERQSGYRSIFEGSLLGLALIEADGLFAELNQALCNIVGYSRDALLRMTFMSLVHPDERADAERKHHALFDGSAQAGAAWEARLLRIDGTAVWCAIRLSPPQGNGHPRLVAAIEDIHQRKMLDESLARLASTLAHDEGLSLAGSWKWHVDTGMVGVSEAVFRMFGLPPVADSVPITQFLARIDESDRPAVEHALELAVAELKPYRVDYRIVLPDGTRRMLTASGEIYRRDAAGKPVLLIGMIQDVTMRKQAEQAARQSELRIRQLFDNAADGILIADIAGNYTDVNQAACSLLGYRRDELIGKDIGALVSEPEHARLSQARAYLMLDPAHAHLAEWQVRRADGTLIPVEISARILPDGRWMATVRDIGERKRIEHELERYVAQVQDLYDNAPCGYHSLDRNGVFVQINKTELNWLGYTRDELIGKKKAEDLMTDESRARIVESFPAFLAQEHLADLEFEFVRKDGSILPVLMSASAVRDDKGNFIMSRTTLFDMTELAAAQAKLRQAATVFDHTNEAIMVTDTADNIIAVNQAFSRITGYQPAEVIGKSPRLLKSERQDSNFYDELSDALEQQGTWQGQIWNQRKDGEQFPAFENISVVKDHSGKITNYISVFSDITTIRQTEERLVKLAYHDALTGLPNRLLLQDRISQAVAHAKRTNTRAALLLLDVDRFKLINDTLGHAAGDALLQVLAERFRRFIGQDDTVARLGGDEFGAIMGDLHDPDEAALMAQKMAALVAEPIHVAGQRLTVTSSIGIALYPDDAHDAQSLSKAADMAMYGAKAKGRNTYDFYTTDMTEAAIQTLAIDHSLRCAVDQGELALQYQPQVNISSGRIVGLEALIRWNRPGKSPMEPERFIRVAEETDLIESIGDWVFDTAWRQLQQWRRDGVPPVHLAINLSVRQLRSAHLLEQVRARLAAGDTLDGFGFDVEITETALQTGSETIKRLSELRATGLRIALDDFGIGYSSLNSLKHLPIDILKIDRSFIKGIPGDAKDCAIASAIIAVGHSMGMRVLAEGVETPEQLAFMSEQLCDEAQGFLLFAPMTAAACTQLMRDSAASGPSAPQALT